MIPGHPQGTPETASAIQRGDPRATSTRLRRALTVLYPACFLAALCCNEWFYGWVNSAPLRPDGALRVKLWVAAVLLLVTGILLRKLRNLLFTTTLRHYLFSRRPALGALVAGCVPALALLLAVECTFLMLNKAKANDGRERTGILSGMHRMHPWLGTVPEPGRKHLGILRCDGRVEYDVTYTLDAFGRRVAPASAIPAEKETPPYYLMCFGGSFMFGEGVEDEEALPNQLALRAPDFEVYNYAFGGYGPNQMLARVQWPNFDGEIRQERGIALYLFIPGHIPRAICSMRLVTSWGRRAPYFDTSSSFPQYRGLFPEALPWHVAAFDLIAKEQVLKYFDADWPPKGREEGLAVCARLAKATEETIWQKWKNVNYYVVFFPANDGNEKNFDRYQEAFEAEGLNVLNYSDLFNRADPEMIFSCDPHPRPPAYRRVAEAIAEDLSLSDAALLKE